MVVNGMVVTIKYAGTLDSGEIFDSTEGKEPFEFTVGTTGVLKGLNEAVLGMEVGEVKTVVLEPEQAFGAYDEDKIVEVPLTQLANPSDFTVGQQVYLAKDGLVVTTKLLGISDGNGRFDFNPPLAGKRLTFRIELVGVK